MMPSRSGSPRHHSSEKKEKKARKGSSGSNSSRSNSSRKSSRSKSQDKRRNFHKEPQKVEPTAKLFVTNIDSKYTQDELDKELRDIFSPFGTLKDVKIKTKAGSNNSYCFIEYENIEDAAKAHEEYLSKYNRIRGKDFKGKELKVEFGRGERKAEDRRSDKCYICHKEGHFAKDCRYNRYNDQPRYSDERYRRGDDRDRRDRNYHDRDVGRDYGRDRDRDRYYDRDRRDYHDRDRRQHRRRRSYSSSSSRSSYDRRRSKRDDYRRHRDSHRSPEKRRTYHQSNRRYD